MAQEGDSPADLKPAVVPGLPVLYSFRRCPYAMRARLAIAASGQRCELREVVLRDKPPALLAASPKGTVPVLVLPGGHVIDQSLEIMLWALGRGDPQGWLVPEAGTLQDMLDLIAECDGDFKQALDGYKYPARKPGADDALERARGARFLWQLEARLAMQTHLFGGRPALADMALAPFVRQFARVDAAWFGAQPWPGLRAWLEALVGGARFEAVMARYTPWRDGEPGMPFPA